MLRQLSVNMDMFPQTVMYCPLSCPEHLTMHLTVSKSKCIIKTNKWYYQQYNNPYAHRTMPPPGQLALAVGLEKEKNNT